MSFKSSLSETPFKPDRVSFCTPKFWGRSIFGSFNWLLGRLLDFEMHCLEFQDFRFCMGSGRSPWFRQESIGPMNCLTLDGPTVVSDSLASAVADQVSGGHQKTGCRFEFWHGKSLFWGLDLRFRAPVRETQIPQTQNYSKITPKWPKTAHPTNSFKKTQKCYKKRILGEMFVFFESFLRNFGVGNFEQFYSNIGFVGLGSLSVTPWIPSLDAQIASDFRSNLLAIWNRSCDFSCYFYPTFATD